MKKEEWKEKYVQTLINVGGLTKKQAKDNFDGIEDFSSESLEEDPEQMALDEMSYWRD